VYSGWNEEKTWKYAYRRHSKYRGKKRRETREEAYLTMQCCADRRPLREEREIFIWCQRKEKKEDMSQREDEESVKYQKILCQRNEEKSYQSLTCLWNLFLPFCEESEKVLIRNRNSGGRNLEKQKMKKTMPKKASAMKKESVKYISGIALL